MLDLDFEKQFFSFIFGKTTPYGGIFKKFRFESFYRLTDRHCSV